MMATLVSTEAIWLVESPFGKVRVRCSPRGVAEIAFVAGARATEPVDAEAQTAFAAEHPWVADLLRELEAYFRGEAVSFADIPLDLDDQPPFWRHVQETCRRIPFGRTVTYTELAKRAGKPAAVRAAGSAMSHNPIPIIIPCHRVLRSDGGLGGYSAPGGISLKQLLLDMERKAM